MLQRNFLWSNSKTFLVRAYENLDIIPMTSEFVKTPKKPAIFDHLLMDGYKASFDNFLTV